jgi:hypothetical protein
MDLSRAHASLNAGATFRMLEQLKLAKTQSERTALYQSDEFQSALASPHRYTLRLAADGSFKTDEIPAGKYELAVDFSGPGTEVQLNNIMAFMSPQQLVVPPAANTNDDSVVDLGTIELKQISAMDFTVPN